MDSQDGKTVLAILITVLIVFAVMWLAVPWLQKTGKLVPDETAAVGMLRSIDAAQKDLYGASRMYGSMGRLSNSKLVAQTQDSFKSGGYEFSHSTNGRGSTWCATATPEAGKSGRRFGIDESGSVYSTQLRCSNGQLTMENGQFPIDEKFRLGK